jgi:hypothetical protein
MQSYTIPYDKESVLSAVQKITGYTGKNVPEGFDRIAATDDEQTLTDDLFDESLKSLAAKLTEYSPEIDKENGVILIRNSSNFNSVVIPAISGAVNNILTNDIASKWFFISREVADAEKYNSQAASDFNDIIPLLLQRNRPKRNGCCCN